MKILGMSKAKVTALFIKQFREKGILFKRNNTPTLGDYTGANYAGTLMGRRLTTA